MSAQRLHFLDSLNTATVVLFGDVDRDLTKEECQGIAFS